MIVHGTLKSLPWLTLKKKKKIQNATRVWSIHSVTKILRSVLFFCLAVMELGWGMMVLNFHQTDFQSSSVL